MTEHKIDIFLWGPRWVAHCSCGWFALHKDKAKVEIEAGCHDITQDNDDDPAISNPA